MLLQNFYKYIQDVVNAPYQNARIDATINCLNTTGSKITACINVATDDGQQRWPIWNRTCHNENMSIIVGSSNATPEADMIYNLVSPISNVSVSNIAVNTSGSNNDITLIVTGTITNNNSSEIEINEVGLIKNFAKYGPSTYQPSLMGRIVLDAPITLSVNSSAIITITTQISY